MKYLFKDRQFLASMWAVRHGMKSMPAVIAAIAIASAAGPGTLAAKEISTEISKAMSHRLVVAQSSMDPDKSQPGWNPAPAPPPLDQPAPPTAKPDFLPSPNPAPLPPKHLNPSADVYWGAIGFTADGSYSSAWKMPSQAEAEAKVAKQCASFGRGGCEVVSFSGPQCAALATFIGNYGRKRWSLSFTAGGNTYPEAQNAAMNRCNSDERSQGKCQPRTAACADGR